VLFDRLFMTFYWFAIVNIDLSCTVFFSYLTLNDIMTLKSGFEVTQDHWKWYHSKTWVCFHVCLPNTPVAQTILVSAQETLWRSYDGVCQMQFGVKIIHVF